MTDARTEIIARIRAALADRPVSPVVDRSYRRSGIGDAGCGDPGCGDVVALFAERVADYRATVEMVAAPDLAAAIGTALTAHRVRRLVVPADLPSSWLTGADVDALA